MSETVVKQVLNVIKRGGDYLVSIDFKLFDGYDPSQTKVSVRMYPGSTGCIEIRQSWKSQLLHLEVFSLGDSGPFKGGGLFVMISVSNPLTSDRITQPFEFLTLLPSLE